MKALKLVVLLIGLIAVQSSFAKVRFNIKADKGIDLIKASVRIKCRYDELAEPHPDRLYPGEVYNLLFAKGPRVELNIKKTQQGFKLTSDENLISPKRNGRKPWKCVTEFQFKANDVETGFTYPSARKTWVGTPNLTSFLTRSIKKVQRKLKRFTLTKIKNRCFEINHSQCLDNEPPYYLYFQNKKGVQYYDTEMNQRFTTRTYFRYKLSY